MEYNMGPGRRDRALELRYEEAEKKAKAIAETLKSKPRPSADEFDASVRSYIRTRMLLEPKDEMPDSLNVLGQMNLARALGVSIPELSSIDMEAKCGGTSAVMTKKILLIMALNRDLGVSVTPDEAAEITKISELIERLYHLYESND
ncbi:acyl carrier protein [Raoultibacter massiliensis]|uniref:acyl carrier protein n=1 Tax=Raoultibacter massiliensis TaxID=1852371 RepID=UPI000C8376C6|nr:acyl carrier protein [Raoultibacter massiliensis]